MKKYKFKLEAVLKMRKMEEEQKKVEIGRLIAKKNELLADIDRKEEGIATVYASQEETVARGATGMDLKFYPYFLEGQRAATVELQRKLAGINSQLALAYEELKVLRGRTKVLEDMKEKDMKAFKKKANKAMEQKIEEQILIWNRFRNGTRDGASE